MSHELTKAPWRAELAHALYRNKSLPHHRYLQLATCRADGTPANRTLVFRGFLEGTDRLVMYTDTRSQKSGQLKYNSVAEICWYFTRTREQFRLRGEVYSVSEDTESAALQRERALRWQQFSAQGQAQFYWPAPGEPRRDNDEQAFATPEINAEQPPANFSLLLLEPSWVELLALRETPHQRVAFVRQDNGRWCRELLNP